MRASPWIANAACARRINLTTVRLVTPVQPTPRTWQIEGMDTSSSEPSRAVGRTLLVGYGKLGSRLARALTADGIEVIALRRTPEALPAGVTGISADVSQPLTETLPRVDSMVVTLPPGERIDSYRVALTHLAQALPAVPDRTVFVSSTGVFAGAGVRAVSPPHTGYARRRADAAEHATRDRVRGGCFAAGHELARAAGHDFSAARR